MVTLEEDFIDVYSPVFYDRFDLFRDISCYFFSLFQQLLECEVGNRVLDGPSANFCHSCVQGVYSKSCKVRIFNMVVRA